MGNHGYPHESIEGGTPHSLLVDRDNPEAWQAETLVYPRGLILGLCLKVPFQSSLAIS